MHPLHRVLWVVVLLLISSGCSGQRASTVLAQGKAARSQPFGHYPHAHWRLANGDELGRTVLWASHIVIMHRQSQSAGSGLRWLGWSPDVIPERSPEDAMALATRVMKDAR